MELHWKGSAIYGATPSSLLSSFCQKFTLAIVFYPVTCSGNTLVYTVRDAQLGIEWIDIYSVSKYAFPENCKMLTTFKAKATLVTLTTHE